MNELPKIAQQFSESTDARFTALEERISKMKDSANTTRPRTTVRVLADTLRSLLFLIVLKKAIARIVLARESPEMFWEIVRGRETA